MLAAVSTDKPVGLERPAGGVREEPLFMAAVVRSSEGTEGRETPVLANACRGRGREKEDSDDGGKQGTGGRCAVGEGGVRRSSGE